MPVAYPEVFLGITFSYIIRLVAPKDPPLFHEDLDVREPTIHNIKTGLYLTRQHDKIHK